MASTVGRRGLLAGAAAVVAGIVAKQAAQPVGAISGGGTGGFLVIGANFGAGNTPNTSTLQTALSGTLPADTMFHGVNFGGQVGNFVSTGLLGQADNGWGVGGLSLTGAAIGGVSNGGGVGVYGRSSSGLGVFGQCDSTTGIGVRGLSALGTAISGTSNGNTGVLGTTTAPGFAGLGGIVSTPGTAAFAGTSTNPNAFAGFFTGDVFVDGNFTVNDPTRKHGAILHPDGTHRLLYSMESPESWLEDFGKGTLVGGTATVTLDPDFAAVVHTDDYHVFLTPYEGVSALRAVRRTATGFAAEEIGGTSNGAFSWRVVAKPQTTNKVTRLAKVAIPDIKVLPPPPLSDVLATQMPAAPKTPAPQAQPPARSSASSGGPPAAAPQGSEVATPATNPVQPAPPPRP